MTDVFIWDHPEYFPNKYIGEYARDISPDRFLYKQGRAVDLDQRPTFCFHAPSARISRYACLPNNAMVPLVRPDVATALEAVCPGQIQWIPANVTTLDGSLNGYQLLNAVVEVKGVDMERSVYVNVPGATAIMKFDELYLVSGCLGSNQLARLAEYHSYLLVSSKVVSLFGTWSGIHFEACRTIG